VSLLSSPQIKTSQINFTGKGRDHVFDFNLFFRWDLLQSLAFIFSKKMGLRVAVEHLEESKPELIGILLAVEKLYSLYLMWPHFSKGSFATKIYIIG